MSKAELLEKLLASIGGHPTGDDVARIEVHHNQVLGSHLVPGLEVEVEEQAEGIRARITFREGAKIANPVHICFGMLPETGVQNIVLDIRAQAGSQASVIAHCSFPNAVDVVHRMDAEITVGAGASYSYFERHVHGPHGGVLVLPKAKVRVEEEGRFRTEFELIKGRVGRIDIDYETTCLAHGVVEMVARISGSKNDVIKIHETALLEGEYARAVLKSYIALRDDAQAEVFNTLRASAAYARGHVDCKEIVQGNAVAKAVPVVEVNHPLAHVTHEAAIGSVDSKQLQTLQSRGLTEDEAVDIIIQGLLS
ncbi:MAG TPA: SufD family Fe-S cluster assembly protein [Candidatus Bathyarchaeia archaeon]|nr:SufD family Fe-S cluster assembly protein [Candidatus Bathyarchaeia archaeon]